MKKFLRSLLTSIKAHKTLTVFIVVVCVVGGYKMYTSAKTGSTAPLYTLAQATIGNITQTVTGSGQVSAENQLDVVSKASGAIASIRVSVGEHVKAGELLAIIDTTDAARSLESARLSYAQTTEPAKIGDITNTKNTLAKSYSDGWNSVADSFTDMQTTMAGLNTALYDKDSPIGISNAQYLNQTAQTYRLAAALSYEKASTAYQGILSEYRGLTRTSATSSIDILIGHAYDVLKGISDALDKTRNTITLITINQPDYQSSGISSTLASVNTWTSAINGDISTVGGAQNSIVSNTNNLSDLLDGADDLTVQAAKLSLEQAEQTYADYFIRAPFDGVIGRIPVSLYTQVGGSTVIATVIGDKKISIISLNEVDAAKVSAGKPVKLTFDAIDGLTATGTVMAADLVGTVSQGVVAYNIKLAIDTEDERIRPGMSVNASIITEQRTGVLIVPSSAVKTRGNTKYVQVLATRIASSTNAQRSGFASSTGAYPMANRPQAGLTVSSATAPTEIIIETGLSDDTNTEITGGLTQRTWVVTKTVAGSGTTAAAAPSILNTLGGSRTASGATLRAGTVTPGR